MNGMTGSRTKPSFACATAGRVLIDPNRWSADSADALGEGAVFDDGGHLAYGVQVGGTDWRRIRVLKVATGARLVDLIDWARFTRLDWTGLGWAGRRMAAASSTRAFPNPGAGRHRARRWPGMRSIFTALAP